MAYLTAVVVVVGLLCLLNLVLILGVVRRLRDHTDRLNQLRRSGSTASVGPELTVGETVGEFTATTTEGGLLRRELLAERTLVGFFTPGCTPCAEQLPRFIESAQALPGGRERVLAVVLGSGVAGADAPAEETEYVSRLAPVAQVVVEAPDGPVQAAFRVTGFPTFYLVEPGGLVTAGGLSMTVLLADIPTPSASHHTVA